ncbi:hypothetical protein H109_03264 [Trichophyton interdigitale MR816]|uniref:Inositol polyphosphate-related phosphatase domain-containing protein n=1 Tax=Trichophyton interdigitale (strain MR816) TaxID=1215338 RepID=A0A059JAI5_TRIIM|nr:hypothetical protein H109_03264 [Trichophyton interdigitale MR816]
MSVNDEDGTDQQSIKPVSSLLSHFENLSHTKREAQDGPGSLLKTPPAADNVTAGRVSLDLPRSNTSWGGSQRPSQGFLRPQQTGDSPTRRLQSRPLSMNLQSSPPGRPIYTTESSRAPPQPNFSYSQSLPHTQSRPPHAFYAPNGHATSNEPSSSPPSSSRTSTRPTTPLDSPSHSVSIDIRRTTPVSQRTGHTGKSTSVPPPVNRAEKPKIPFRKPGISPGHDAPSSNTLAPLPSSQRTSIDDRISPFSTPPSSPEKVPGTPKLNGVPEPFSLGDSHVTSRIQQLQPAPRPSPGPISREGPPVSRLTKGNLISGTVPNAISPRLPPAVGAKSTAAIPITQPLNRQNDDDDQAIRQNAQTRRPSPAPPRRLDTSRAALGLHREDVPSPQRVVSAVEPQAPNPYKLPPRSLSIKHSKPTPPPPPPPRRETSNLSVKSNKSTNRPPPPPSNPPTRYRPPATAATSDNDAIKSLEQLTRRPEPMVVTDTDIHPDATHTNRRPPFFRSGAADVYTKYDTRVFDVCGQYACTTGFYTRVWDLVTGEMVMNLNHGETVKGSAIAFKPGRTVDEEGAIIWIGTTAGELLEVDVRTQVILNTRPAHSRREIIRIYRYQKELWSLDDEGKLLVWTPDESGAPNLQYSYNHPYDRMVKGHTFSMVVGDTIWYASGKEVRLYKPHAHDTAFQVLTSPLGKHHSSEVTCGTMTTTNGGMVYLGHADGKVTIYRSKDYAYLGTVTVSMYKISSLAMVGDYLWASYKTGMIYVYDTSTNPWTVKKDWSAHNHGVCGITLDLSSVWTVNKLQVISLGVDNYLRIWDAMLEEDWLEARMQSRDIEYCQFNEISAAIVTWNAGATVPGKLPNSNFIRDAIHPESSPDILVFGFQELVDLEDKKITAKSFLKGKKKDADKERMSRQYRVWKDYLALCIREHMPINESYVLLHTASLIGLFTCVFVRQETRERITNVSAAEVKRGMGGLHGNKGALILRFLLDDSSLCFVNCHLAAGQSQTAHRNNDIAAIMESEALPREPSLSARIDRYTGGGDGSMILDHEICILNGDLNYRIDSIPRNTVIEAVKANNLPKLLDRDQLLASKRKNPGFRLRTFNEAPITFAPTYKYDVGTDDYDSSEKKRAPAWCDRLLYRGFGRIKQLEYRRHEVRVSDHRPVSGTFKIRVKSIIPKKRTATWENCQEEFLTEKQRLATEASVSYLVRFLGLSPREAYALITSPPGA